MKGRSWDYYQEYVDPTVLGPKLFWRGYLPSWWWDIKNPEDDDWRARKLETGTNCYFQGEEWELKQGWKVQGAEQEEAYKSGNSSYTKGGSSESNSQMMSNGLDHWGRCWSSLSPIQSQNEETEALFQCKD